MERAEPPGRAGCRLPAPLKKARRVGRRDGVPTETVPETSGAGHLQATRCGAARELRGAARGRGRGRAYARVCVRSRACRAPRRGPRVGKRGAARNGARGGGELRGLPYRHISRRRECEFPTGKPLWRLRGAARCGAARRPGRLSGRREPGSLRLCGVAHRLPSSRLPAAEQLRAGASACLVRRGGRTCGPHCRRAELSAIDRRSSVPHSLQCGARLPGAAVHWHWHCSLTLLSH